MDMHVVVSSMSSVSAALSDTQTSSWVAYLTCGTAGGKRVGCSVVETFGEKGQARDLDEVLRLEYRSKLLNPKWAEVLTCPASLTVPSALLAAAICSMRPWAERPEALEEA